MLDHEQNPEDVTEELLDDDAALDVAEPEQEAEPEPEQAEDEGELVITLGDDDEADDDPASGIDTSEMTPKQANTIQKLREAYKAKAKAERDARIAAEQAAARLAALEQAARPKVEFKPRPKPVDYGYDDALFDRALDEWQEHNKAFEAEQARVKAQQEAEMQAVRELQKGYVAGIEKLAARDYQDAEKAVMAALSDHQQRAVLKVCADPAKLVYFLGKRPDHLAKLAAENDLAVFGAKASSMEKEIKVERKQPPPVETRLQGGNGAGASGGTLSAQIEAARKAAERSGDYNQYFTLKRKLNAVQGRR